MRRNIYLILAVLGFVVPYYFFISFLVTNGLQVQLFFRQLFGTPVSTFFAADLLLSCVVFMVYSGREARRHSMKHAWLPTIALFTVGLSCALPLFLYLREPYLSKTHVDFN